MENWNQDINKLSTERLIAYLEGLTLQRKHQPNQFAARALELRIIDVERTIAVHNARATARLDGMSEDRLIQVSAVMEAHAMTARIPDIHGMTEELIAEVRRLQGEVAMMLPRYTPPEQYPHLRTCGTEYRGCDPACPKEQAERAAGEIDAAFEEIAGKVGEVEVVDGIEVVRRA